MAASGSGGIEGPGLTRRQMLGAVALTGTATLVCLDTLPAAATDASRLELYYGRDAPPSEILELRAGRLTAWFEPQLAFLRHLRLGGREVLRGVYSAVRDRNWGTVSPQVRNLRIEQAGLAFAATFDVECRQEPIDFFWKGQLKGDKDGTVRFSMDGEARSAFLRNRIGFCVLHPIRECAGQPCTVEHVDRSVEKGRFPDLISPHQPFFAIRAISHQVEPGVEAEVRVEGDTFEMEDQRNWTDASYKTYCTPLALPFPAEVPAGTRIRQSVTVMLKGRPRVMVSVPPASVALRVEGTPVPLPRIGMGIATESPALDAREVSRLRATNPAHLRVDLKPGEDSWKELFRRAGRESAALSTGLEAAVFLSDAAEDELRAVAAEAESLKPRIARWLIFHVKENSTSEHWVRLARQQLKGPIGTGTNANFTELNRGRPGDPPEVVCYSANPQVHAFDNLSLAETFEGLRDTVRTARQFIGKSELAVTPVTFKPRFNPVATAAETRPPSGELPSSVDERQMSLFGAGWTLGSLQALAERGVEHLTYYETTGWRGLMETSGGSPLLEKFRSVPGSVFPLYHVLADAGEFAGGEVVPVNSSAPLEVVGVMLRRGERKRFLAANLTPRVQYMRIHGSRLGPRLRIWKLDEHSAPMAMRRPEEFRRSAGRLVQAVGDLVEVALLPYGYVRADPAA